MAKDYGIAGRRVYGEEKFTKEKLISQKDIIIRPVENRMAPNVQVFHCANTIFVFIVHIEE